jgi:hypothetical protein
MTSSVQEKNPRGGSRRRLGGRFTTNTIFRARGAGGPEMNPVPQPAYCSTGKAEPSELNPVLARNRTKEPGR